MSDIPIDAFRVEKGDGPAKISDTSRASNTLHIKSDTFLRSEARDPFLVVSARQAFRWSFGVRAVALCDWSLEEKNRRPCGTNQHGEPPPKTDMGHIRGFDGRRLTRWPSAALPGGDMVAPHPTRPMSSLCLSSPWWSLWPFPRSRLLSRFRQNTLLMALWVP